LQHATATPQALGSAGRQKPEGYSYEPDELLQRGAAHFIAEPFHLKDWASFLRLLRNRTPAEFLSSGNVCQG